MSHCADASHEHSVAELLAAAERLCAERGLRLTPVRRRVLELVAASAHPLKAYDLLDHIRQDQRLAAPPTVYRALDFLLDLELVHKLESISAFVACPHPGTRHPSQFLICTRCHAAIELEDRELASRVDRVARAQHFDAESAVVEIHGRCARCG